MKMILLYAVFVVALVHFSESANVCDVGGEEYRCRDYETASKCGVVAHCRLTYPSFNEQKIKFSKNEEIKAAPSPVKIELYYESFCGGCRQFILGQLFPTFQKLFSTGILDVALYPYGNAIERNVGGKWVFTCQHGEEECQVNKLEACALHMLLHPTQFMPYIKCVETQPGMTGARVCADKLKIEWDPIENCYNGTQGSHLMHEMAVKTGQLNPPHQYVPWIVANGQHTNEIQESCQTDLLHYVCETYTGVKPHVCRVATPDRSNSVRARLIPEGKCYKKKLY